jgi:magnesium-transporting ATPase (P-type)
VCPVDWRILAKIIVDLRCQKLSIQYSHRIGPQCQWYDSLPSHGFPKSRLGYGSLHSLGFPYMVWNMANYFTFVWFFYVHLCGIWFITAPSLVPFHIRCLGYTCIVHNLPLVSLHFTIFSWIYLLLYLHMRLLLVVKFFITSDIVRHREVLTSDEFSETKVLPLLHTLSNYSIRHLTGSK